MIREVWQTYIRPVKNLSGALAMCRNFFHFCRYNLKIKMDLRSEKTSMLRYEPEECFIRVFFYFLKKKKCSKQYLKPKQRTRQICVPTIIRLHFFEYFAILNLSAYTRVSINTHLLFKINVFSTVAIIMQFAVGNCIR